MTEPDDRPPHRSRAQWVALGVLSVALVVAAAVLVPWRTLPGGQVVGSPALDFTAAERHHDTAFHAALRSWTYPRVLLVLGVTLVLGLTPLGSRLVGWVGRRLGGSWPATVLGGTLVLTVLTTLVALPLSAGAEVVLRHYGLSTQDWSSWFTDALRSTAVEAVITGLALLVLVGLARRWPHGWWVPGAALAALLVVVGSLLYPVVVEPLSNRFSSLPPGTLRTELLQLAERDGHPVRDVLVADASRRTTAENAYVSGLGATRRLVVYDTLLHGASPAEVKAVVAHELGHVANYDVRTGTTLGALAAAWAVVAASLLLEGRWWRRRAGVRGVGDPRSIAFLLALLATGSWLASPASNLVSRRIEARADVHSLQLTRDPETFARMQRGLAIANIDDLSPRWYRELFLETHPSTPWRIGLSRVWAQQHDLPVPPPLAGP